MAMGIGGSGSMHDNNKKTTSPKGHGTVGNVVERGGVIKKNQSRDALHGCCNKHSPVKAKGK